MIDRMIGCALFNAHAYEDVENDGNATVQALIVVVLAAIAAGIGALGTGGGIRGLFLGILAALVGWVLWAWLTYLIGTKLLPAPETRASWAQLARGLGFAQTPGILAILGFIPLLGGLILFALIFWLIGTGVVAVRQALDYDSTLRALAVVVIAFIPYVIIRSLVALVTGV